MWVRETQEYLRLLRRNFFDEPCLRPGETCQWCSFGENFEAILSFIDLNLDTDIHATVEDAGGEPVDRTKPCAFWTGPDLDQLRGHIANLLFLTLAGPYQTKPLLKDFAEILSKGDVIVTFNYDLVLEKELWSRGLWNPRDGYGLSFDPTDISLEASIVRTKLPLYKLHGSLNWTPVLGDGQITMRAFHDDATPVFAGYLADESPPPVYQGGHSPLWLLPSYLKPFSSPEILTIWERAHKALRESGEVVLIGYSLPDVDAAAHVLLGTAGIAGKSLTVVDPNVANLTDSIKRITGAVSVESFERLDDYVAARRNAVGN